MTILEEIRSEKFSNAYAKWQRQRNSNFSKELSDRTLRLMSVIVAADTQYDIDNGICYDCDVNDGVA